MEKRFEEVYRQGGKFSGYKVLKDKKTDVLYLFYNDGAYGGGLTPLLDKDGKPTVEA